MEKQHKRSQSVTTKAKIPDTIEVTLQRKEKELENMFKLYNTLKRENQ